MIERRRLLPLLGCSAALLTGTWPAQAAIDVPPAFQAKLKQYHMILNTAVLADFQLARVLPNSHFEYDFSVRHGQVPFEIRYSMRDLSSAENLSQLIPQFFYASVMNMARENPGMIGPKPFPPQAVRQEFGADWGAVSKFMPRPTFAKASGGVAVAIFKSQIKALAYSVFLYEADDGGEMKADADPLFASTFHAFRFN